MGVYVMWGSHDMCICTGIPFPHVRWYSVKMTSCPIPILQSTHQRKRSDLSHVLIQNFLELLSYSTHSL